VASSASEPRPVVGVTTYVERAAYGVWDHEATLLPRTYADAVLRAGGAPVLLPTIGPALPEVVGRLDALVLSGGADVDPANYGREAHPRTVSRPERDASELGLLAHALAAGVPVLAVCRGAQLLNVALGGTLVQHLPDVVGSDDHQPGRGVFGRFDVDLAAGSRAAGILGERASVLCYHHQAVDALGEGLVVSARDADGVVQAVERPGDPFVLGVQFHPEQDADDDRLFRAVVEAGRAHAAARTAAGVAR